MTATDFLERIEDTKLKTIERAIALLWWAGRGNPTKGLSPQEICSELELAGHPKQNASHLADNLQKHRGTVKVGKEGWRLHPRMRRDLDAHYAFALLPRATQATDSVLPMSLFIDTRKYIERVVEQINKSYDCELWDCSSVMCRRPLETLIIETYEGLGRSNEIKGADGHFMMLNGLITFLERETTFSLGRNAMKGLKDFKQLGDQSAHNRRFTACRNDNDIDRVRDGLRIATEELLHLSNLRNSPNSP
jgi:hypothetical protein